MFPTFRSGDRIEWTQDLTLASGQIFAAREHGHCYRASVGR